LDILYKIISLTEHVPSSALRLLSAAFIGDLTARFLFCRHRRLLIRFFWRWCFSCSSRGVRSGVLACHRLNKVIQEFS